MRALLPLVALVFGGVAWAHPMGNLSVNRYARLEPGAKGLVVTYVLDLAEIPTFELMQTWDVTRDTAKPVLDGKAAEQAKDWIGKLSFTENGRRLNARILGVQLTVADGAGNLPVFRVTTRLQVPAAGGRLEYEDGNYATRAGWREIVIVPTASANMTKASAGDTDLSQALTSYPQDPTKAPPQDTHAWLEWAPASGPVTQIRQPEIRKETPAAAAPAAARGLTPPERPALGVVKRNDSISNLLRTKTISWPIMATLIGLAFWFGALHALEPGHGKTMVAAYLVGSRGTPKHAILLGGMVTFTHTISVFILGIATMFLSQYVMPDKISKVLGIVSGLSIVWIGAMLLWRRVWNLPGSHRHHHHDHDHEHSHTHDHDHSHGALTHTHDGHTHSHVPEGDISIGSLLALGASGGMVPCPSALILLLSAISIGRIGLGLILLLSFSLGLAIVLMAIGMAVLYARSFLPESRGGPNAFFRYMPVFSAAVILMIGVVMTSVSLGWIAPNRFFG